MPTVPVLRGSDTGSKPPTPVWGGRLVLGAGRVSGVVSTRRLVGHRSAVEGRGRVSAAVVLTPYAARCQADSVTLVSMPGVVMTGRTRSSITVVRRL